MDWIKVIEVSTPIVITFIVSVISYFIINYLKHHLEVIRNREKRLRQERRDLYNEILKPFNYAFTSIKNPSEKHKGQKLIQSSNYRETTCKFYMIASDEVISAINNYMQFIYYLEDKNTEEEDNKKLLKLWAMLLLECRKDLDLNPAIEYFD